MREGRRCNRVWIGWLEASRCGRVSTAKRGQRQRSAQSTRTWSAYRWTVCAGRYAISSLRWKSS